MPFPTIDNDMLDTGLAEGQIPLIGAGGKLNTSLIDTGITDGKIVQLDGSARLPAVDASLLTNLSGGAGGAGGKVLLDTVNASNSAEIVFSNFINATYKNYVVEMTSIRPSVGAANLLAQVSNDAGSTYLTGYDSHTQTLTNAAATYASLSLGGSAQIELAPALANLGTGSCHGSFIIHDPSVPQNHSFSGQFSYLGVSADASGGMVYAELSGSYVLNAVKFFLSAGNFVQGTFKLYGLS